MAADVATTDTSTELARMQCYMCVEYSNCGANLESTCACSRSPKRRQTRELTQIWARGVRAAASDRPERCHGDTSSQQKVIIDPTISRSSLWTDDTLGFFEPQIISVRVTERRTEYVLHVNALTESKAHTAEPRSRLRGLAPDRLSSARHSGPLHRSGLNLN